QSRGRFLSRLRSSRICSVGLTVEQKCQLALRELTDVKAEIQRKKEDSEQTLQNLEAVIEETDVWRTAVQEAISDFAKFSSSVSCNKRSIVSSETLLRYMKEKNRQRDLLREKLLSKNYLLKAHKKKLQKQLMQEEMGDALHEACMQHLQVVKEQYQEKLNEKNQELLQLSQTLGKTIRVFNFYKTRLQTAMETSLSLMKDISQRKKLMKKMEREAALVEEQRADAECMNQQMRKQLSDYRVPPVLSYVEKKMTVTDLKSSLKSWERKVAFAEMTLQRCHKVWKQVKMSHN
ncbi:CC113 protein, partial [Rhinopomastus cyanomelas]|nr:CC113 protein [Rhinopomastus cyanomelas]